MGQLSILLPGFIGIKMRWISTTGGQFSISKGGRESNFPLVGYKDPKRREMLHYTPEEEQISRRADKQIREPREQAHDLVDIYSKLKAS